jgi:hypothetical protein
MVVNKRKTTGKGAPRKKTATPTPRSKRARAVALDVRVSVYEDGMGRYIFLCNRCKGPVDVNTNLFGSYTGYPGYDPYEHKGYPVCSICGNDDLQKYYIG